MARPPALVTRLCTSRTAGDCATVALSTYTGRSYDDVAAAVRRYTRARPGKGLTTEQIQRVAARLGTPLRYSERYDADDTYALIVTPTHAAVLRAGLVFDVDGTVAEHDDWVALQGSPATGVLVAVED